MTIFFRLEAANSSLILFDHTFVFFKGFFERILACVNKLGVESFYLFLKQFLLLPLLEELVGTLLESHHHVILVLFDTSLFLF